MPLPQPQVALNGVCSVIFNNTLYAYSADAFQALPLEPGAQWQTLPQGEKVTGGVCVGSTPKDATQAGFYVVGGTGVTPGYLGLQKFTYSTGKWQAITPASPVTQDRLLHGAAYINSTDLILIYAGQQDGTKNPSSSTFTVGASAPYLVTSYTSIAPPTTKPILLPWSESQAVLVGGSASNAKLMLFSTATNWTDSGATLAEPLQKDSDTVKAVIVTGDDGCKNLYTFDMMTSPNSVNRTVLMDGTGKPVQNSVPIAGRATASHARKHAKVERRDLTLDSWPAYNSTLAPKSTRTNYAVAEDPEGLVVIAGGNQDDVLCMFDGRQNGWQNATQRFTDQKVFAADVTATSSTSTSTPTSTPSTAASSTLTTPTPASASSTSPAETTAASASGTVGTNVILGVILGIIFGLAILLGLAYWCIVRRKKRQSHIEAGHARRASGLSSSEKGGVGFTKDMLPVGPSGAGVFRGHNPSDSQNSFSSVAILMGRVNNQNKTFQSQPGLDRTPSKETKRSSASSMFKKALKSTISKPIQQTSQFTPAPAPAPVSTTTRQLTPGQLETRDDKGVSFAANTAEPRPRPAGAGLDRQGSTRRSSGWNRYWSGGSTLNILGFGGGNNANGQSGPSKRTTVGSDRSSNYSDRATQHRITQDSATVPPLQMPEPRASFSRVNSGSPTISHYNTGKLQEGMTGRIERPVSRDSSDGGYSSGIPASVHEAWDPTAMMSQAPWGSARAPSSAYNTSMYSTPLAPARQPSQNKGSRERSGSRGNNGAPPSGVSQQPQLAMAATSSDMSWLNLGEYNGLNGRGY